MRIVLCTDKHNTQPLTGLHLKHLQDSVMSYGGSPGRRLSRTVEKGSYAFKNYVNLDVVKHKMTEKIKPKWWKAIRKKIPKRENSQDLLHSFRDCCCLLRGWAPSCLAAISLPDQSLFEDALLKLHFQIAEKAHSQLLTLGIIDFQTGQRI